MRRINVNIRPNDGYWFQDASGSKFKGTSWAKVVKKVTEFRRLNGLPTDSVLEEVMAQACSRNPALCRDATPAPPKPQPTLKGRILGWLASIASFSRRTQLDYARYPEMKDRAERCLRCPHQKHISNSCSSCVKQINAHTTTILRREHTLDKRVAGCDILGCYLPVAVWLDEPAVDNPQLPGHCWRKKVDPA